MALTLAGDGEITGFDPTASGFGKVLQVVSATSTTDTTISSTTFTDTGLSATITPTSATSKIFIITSQNTRVSQNASATPTGSVRILRNTTSVHSSRALVVNAAISGASTILELIISLAYVDSPTTTSAITYKTQGCVDNTANSALIRFQTSGTPSTITLIEVAA